MIITKEGGTTTIVYQENTELKTFMERFDAAYGKLRSDNLIINLFSFRRLTGNDLLEFLERSNAHKAGGKSFVLVSDLVSYGEVPQEISLAPTLQEAGDLIEMEEIERDLDL